MWPKAKRAVSDETAAAIAAAAREGGAAAVGVFVDEDASTITQRCRQAGIQIAQLHGDDSRASLNSIPTDLQVRHVQKSVLQANAQMVQTAKAQIAQHASSAGAAVELEKHCWCSAVCVGMLLHKATISTMVC